jgi:hypothetical protein
MPKSAMIEDLSNQLIGPTFAFSYIKLNKKELEILN